MKIIDFAAYLPNILFFCTIVENKSISVAAQKFNVPVSRVSRKLAELEKALGCSLMRRGNRFEGLTETGELLYHTFFDEYKKLNDFINSIERIRISSKSSVRLKFNITMLTNLEYLILDFNQQNPDVRLEVVFSNRELEYTKESFDLAIVNSLPKLNNLKVTLLTKAKAQFYCTPEYINKYGVPAVPGDLVEHKLISWINPEDQPVKQFQFIDQEGNCQNVSLDSALATNSAAHALAFAYTNEYIIGSSDIFLKNELLAGRLIKLLPEYHWAVMNYYLVRLNKFSNKAIDKVAKFIINSYQDSRG